MNGFIPNTLNRNAPPPPQPVVVMAAAAAAVAPPQQQPAILMNGAIPNHHQQQQPQPQLHPPQVAAQLVHYVQHPGVGGVVAAGIGGGPAPQLMIPNGNVIQLAPSPQPPAAGLIAPQALYLPQQSPPVRMVMMNGAIPGQPPHPQQMAPRAQQQQQQQQRFIRLTPNGTYVQTVAGAPTPTSTTLILTKPPPPRCILCCLACCGLESLWYNPNFHFSRVIALICNILVDLLMILCLLSTNWLTTVKYRQGLWQYCIDVDSPRPLPFGLNDHDGCHWGRDAAYIKLSGFFAVACFVLAIIATILTSLGLSSRDPNKKYTFYRFALYINLGALLAIIVSLTLYPAFFYSELHHTNMVPANRPHWYFGWAYGVGWGAAIFLVGAILLLVCDKETEEIYYQERTIVHAANNHLQHHHHHQPLANNNHNNHQQSIKA